jgi:SAM-dependent methyltransferase
MPDPIVSEFTHQADTFDQAAVYRTEETLDRLVELLPLDPHDAWVDVACGTGIVSLVLAPRVASVVGLDLTPAMLARARTAAAGIANVRFVEGKAEALPFPDGHFAGAVTRFSLHHLPRPERMVAEMARVVRPGGWVALADHLTSGHGVAALWHQAIERLRDPSHWACLPPDAFFAIGTAAGLELVRREELPFHLDFADWLARGSGGPAHRDDILALLASPPVGADAAMRVTAGRLHYRLGLGLWRRPTGDSAKE